MTTASSLAHRAAATPLTFAALPGGGFPSVLTEDHARGHGPGRRRAHVRAPPVRGSAEREELPGLADGQPVRNPADRRRESPAVTRPGTCWAWTAQTHRKLRRTIGHLFTRDAADALRPQMRETAARLLDQIAPRGTGDLRADYAEPATAATVCAALRDTRRGLGARSSGPPGRSRSASCSPGAGSPMPKRPGSTSGTTTGGLSPPSRPAPTVGWWRRCLLAMNRAGYTAEEIVRAVATVSNGATALLPVLERVLLWLLHHPDSVAEVFLGERTWAQVVREAIVQEALFPVTPPLVAGKDARIGQRPVPEGTLVLPSLVSAVHHPRARGVAGVRPRPAPLPG